MALDSVILITTLQARKLHFLMQQWGMLYRTETGYIEFSLRQIGGRSEIDRGHPGPRGDLCTAEGDRQSV